MKPILSMVATVAILVACAVMATAQSTKPVATAPTAATSFSKEDMQGVRKTVMSFAEIWNTHEMKALGGLFTADAEFINVVGMHWRGRAAIVAAHEAFHATMFKNVPLKYDTVEIRPLGSDYALAVVTMTVGSFTTPSGMTMPEGRDIATYVLARTADGWKIIHGENVMIDPEAAKHDPINSPRK